MGLFSPQIATRTLVPLCRQLSTAYGAGLPILQTVENAGSQSRDRTVQRVFRTMGAELRGGQTLGEAAKSQAKYLPPFFVHLLASGERGGKLDVMLTDLAEYYEEKLAMRRKVQQMLALPVFELIAAWFLGTFALGILDVVQGSMSDSATRSGTSGIANVTEYFDTYLQFQARAMIAAAVLFAAAIALSRLGVLDRVTGLATTYLWPLSRVTQRFAMAQFFRSFALLVSSGTGIVSCIESAAATTANLYIERDLLKAVPLVKRGKTLTEAFAPCRFLTPLSRQMIEVGEQSGNLEGQAKKISEYHLAEASQAVAMATKVMGTLIVLGVGCTVGFIIITFYTRLYGGLMDELGI